MTIDLGSRTPACRSLTQNICRSLIDIAGHGSDMAPVLLQGSGTFAVEAMLLSLVPRDGCVLVVANGEYGRRIATICEVNLIACHVAELDEYKAVTAEKLTQILSANPEVTQIALVHFETALGVVNDIESIIKLCERRNLGLLVDAMSSFGALPLPFSSPQLNGVAASSNKCLHGVPGLAFVFCRLPNLLSLNTPRSLSLDLKQQYLAFEKDGQWRFTPPVQVMLAFDQALREFHQQGAVSARLAKYRNLNARLVARLAPLGMVPIIDHAIRAPMVTTFSLPDSIRFEQLYQTLLEQGFVIYPSKIKSCFRLGCIGELVEHDIDCLTSAIASFVEGERRE